MPGWQHHFCPLQSPLLNLQLYFHLDWENITAPKGPLWPQPYPTLNQAQTAAAWTAHGVGLEMDGISHLQTFQTLLPNSGLHYTGKFTSTAIVASL